MTTTYRYLTAAEWGMTWKRPAVPEKLNDPEAFVHHSAGGRLSRDAAAAFRALNKMAQDGKDYSALDYDILVHYDIVGDVCTIGAGRSEWMSAATLDRNERGEAICAMGYFHPGHALSQEPHPAEIEGVARAIVWGIEKGWIARDAAVLGHRDNPAHLGATACPGDFLYAHMPTIRARVAALLNPPKVTMWNQPKSVRDGVISAPPTDLILAGRADTWGAIACVKFVQKELGMEPTGVWDQKFGDAFNKAFGYKP